MKPIKQKGKENKETHVKDARKSEKTSSEEKLDKKDELIPEVKPATPTKHAKTKEGSPSKMQVSFDSSILSSTEANDQLFESIEDQTLPDMDLSSPEHSESSGKVGIKGDNLDDSLNKDIEDIEDTEVMAGNIDVEIEEAGEKSKSPPPDVPKEQEVKKEEDVKAISPVTVSETPSKSEPAVTSTPAKEVSELAAGAKSSTPGSAVKSQKELELEEYRAKLAEKRRQAREKAEREAELERQRQEQIRYNIVELIKICDIINYIVNCQIL